MTSDRLKDANYWADRMPGLIGTDPQCVPVSPREYDMAVRLAESYRETDKAIQLAVSCIAGGFGVETADELAETHPAAAGALRVLMPFASETTLKAIQRKHKRTTPLADAANEAIRKGTQ